MLMEVLTDACDFARLFTDPTINMYPFYVHEATVMDIFLANVRKKKPTHLSQLANVRGNTPQGEQYFTRVQASRNRVYLFMMY